MASKYGAKITVKKTSVLPCKDYEGNDIHAFYMGVGSEVCGALKLDRRGVGIELKPTYYKQAVENLKLLKEKKEQLELIS